MKSSFLTLFGVALGMGAGVALTLHQAQPATRDGQEGQVVAWVRKNKVVETPLWKRCLVVGLACGILGGAAGHRIGAGGGVVPAAVGALVVMGLAQYVEDHLLPNRHGRAGEQSHDVTLLYCGLLGAAVGAGASARVRALRESRAE